MIPPSRPNTSTLQRRRLLAAASLAAVSRWGVASTQPPVRNTLRLLVATPPGGPLDAVARLLAPALAVQLGGSALVENRPGASGIVAVRTLMGAPADGQTLLLAANSLLATQKANPRSGFDAERDLLAVAALGELPNVYVASALSRLRSLVEVVALSKTRPVNYGSIGVGSTGHIMSQHLFATAGAGDIRHVPYAGSAPILAALAAGELDLAIIAASAAMPLIRAGRVTALAGTGMERVPGLPETPTLAQAGFPGHEFTTRIGVFLPAGAPRETAEQLGAAVASAVASQEIAQKLKAIGLEGRLLPADEFRQVIADELRTWARVIAATGFRLDN